jgi:hypothetical protein
MVDHPQAPDSHDPSPINHHGETDGPEPEPQPAAPDAPGQAISAEASQAIAATREATSPSLTSPLGPESSTAVLDAALSRIWCPKCAKPVETSEKGACRSCGRMLAGNRVRTRLLPLNVARRNELARQYEADFQPATTHTRSMCQRLAAVCELLERCKLGSPDHQRLEQISQQLATELDASRPAAHAHEDVDRMDIDQLAAEAERLIELVRRPRRIPPAPQTSSPIPAVPIAKTEAPPQPAPAPEPNCQYCRKLFADCTALHETDLGLWRILHFNDPTEVDRRGIDASKEMHESLRRARFGDPWVD